MAKVAFTAGRLADFRCPQGKAQAFLWDSTAPGLALRETAAGARAYVFQSRFNGATVRVTIGGVDAWSIKAAQERARELQTTIDGGRDPREVKAEQVAADAAARQARLRVGVTVGQAWAVYVADRRPHWGERHSNDHERLTRSGGKEPKRGIKDAKKNGTLTVAGPLRGLMALPLARLDSETVEAWARREAVQRPTQARLALRLLKAFLTWCASHSEYRDAVAAGNAAKSKRAREVLGTPKPKNDSLLREQLPVWFAAVRAMQNPMHAAYVQALLLCGCRPGEMLELRWDDLDTHWRSLTIRDKVEGERTSCSPTCHAVAGIHGCSAAPSRRGPTFPRRRLFISEPVRQSDWKSACMACAGRSRVLPRGWRCRSAWWLRFKATSRARPPRSTTRGVRSTYCESITSALRRGFWSRAGWRSTRCWPRSRAGCESWAVRWPEFRPRLARRGEKPVPCRPGAATDCRGCALGARWGFLNHSSGALWTKLRSG